MPSPNKDETQKEFISRCIPVVMDDGTADNQAQAVAVCYSIWRTAKEDKNMDKRLVHIKSIDDDKVIIGGYACIWGSEEDRDLDSEYFTKETDFWLDKMPGDKPVLFEHGFHEAAKKSILGHTLKLMPDDIGLDIEAELDRHNAYIEAVLELARRGVLGWSSGAVSHLVETLEGKIKSWPIAEMTLTLQPAEPRLLGVDALAKLFNDADIEMPQAFVKADKVETDAAEDESVDTQAESSQLAEDIAKIATVAIIIKSRE